MPIYEYRCGGCERRVSLFFPSFTAAESRTAAGENHCPRCGSANLTRLMSRVRALRAGQQEIEDFSGEEDGLLNGLDQEDPRAVAQWARRMKDSMGEEFDMGPEFDHALARIESGEDPDKVMDDLDPEALGGGGEGYNSPFEDDEGDSGEDFGPTSIGLG